MNNHLLFAASYDDALEATRELGLVFDETVWVLNAQLLGSGDYAGHTVHYTDTFRLMPAYPEAAAHFGDTPTAKDAH